MMRHYNQYIIFVIVLLSSVTNAIAQNLVLNPSFEDHKPCPLYSIFQGQYQVNAALDSCYHWNTILGPCSSYFTDCTGPNGTSTPPNIPGGGYKYPRTGKCLVYINNLYQNDSTGAKDSSFVKYYIHGDFSKPLQAGITYHIGCYVGAGSGSTIYTDNFGIYISDTELKQKQISFETLTIFVKPQIINPIGNILSNTGANAWAKVDGYYTAHGGEKYLTFGSFDKDQHKKICPCITLNPPGGAPNYFAVFIYVDDVFAFPVYPQYKDTIIRIGHDTAICMGDTLVLRYGMPYSTTQHWQDGSTADSFVVTKPGIYKLTHDSAGFKFTDSIVVAFGGLSVSGLPRYFMSCVYPYMVSLPLSSNTYTWPDGSNGNTFKADSAGKYYYTVTTGKCTAKDSVILSVGKIARYLPTDTTVCTKNTIKISLPPGNAYLWQDGSKGSSMVINQPGTYWVQATEGLCTGTDTMHVFSYPPVNLHLPVDTVFCRGHNFFINLDSIKYPVLWQDGSMSKHYEIKKSGLYTVTVTNACGTTTAEINVRDSDCACHIFAPNAFTPDNRDLNQQFLVVSECNPVSCQMQIYNRWGEMVFQTNNINTGWDGTNTYGWNGIYKQIYCPDGVYFWQIIYKMQNAPEQLDSGTVILLR